MVLEVGEVADFTFHSSDPDATEVLNGCVFSGDEDVLTVESYQDEGSCGNWFTVTAIASGSASLILRDDANGEIDRTTITVE